MHAFVVRTTVYSETGDPAVRDYAVLSASARDAMVAVIRDRPVGVLIERTDRVLSAADAAALALEPGIPRAMP